jgi:thioredoxin-dependent peroxiredoxin
MMHTRFFSLVILSLFVSTWSHGADTSSTLDKPPAVGDTVPDFTWKTLDDREVSLAGLVKEGPVVVVMLRGYPGYQCPLCTKQVGSLLASKQAFADKSATVVLVYPGAAKGLAAKAREFLGKTELPNHFLFVTDPGYTFTDAIGLRWDAPKETAYPSTLVIDRDQKVVMAVVSESHGGRAETRAVLDAIGK